MSYHDRSDVLDDLMSENPIGDCLDGDDYECGAVEAAASTAKNNSRVLVRLARLLMEKGLLSKREAIDTLYEYGTTEWTKHETEKL